MIRSISGMWHWKLHKLQVVKWMYVRTRSYMPNIQEVAHTSAIPQWSPGTNTCTDCVLENDARNVNHVPLHTKYGYTGVASIIQVPFWQSLNVWHHWRSTSCNCTGHQGERLKLAALFLPPRNSERRITCEQCSTALLVRASVPLPARLALVPSFFF